MLQMSAKPGQSCLSHLVLDEKIKVVIFEKLLLRFDLLPDLFIINLYRYFYLMQFLLMSSTSTSTTTGGSTSTSISTIL